MTSSVVGARRGEKGASNLSSLRAGTAPIRTWQVCIDAVPHTVQGTECRSSISPDTAFVYRSSSASTEGLCGSTGVSSATFRFGSAVVAIAASATVRRRTASKPGCASNARPMPVGKAVVEGAENMPSEQLGIVRGENKPDAVGHYVKVMDLAKQAPTTASTKWTVRRSIRLHKRK
jgi:hypothetical protein